jgi:hypothetical protein
MNENKDKSKLDMLYPELERVKLGGINCSILRLKFKHTILVARMLTRTMGFVDWDKIYNSDQKQMITYLLMSMVYSPDDFYEFLDSLLVCDKEQKAALSQYLREDMTNDEAIEIAEKSIKQDYEEIRGWLKKVMTLTQAVEKMDIPEVKPKKS